MRLIVGRDLSVNKIRILFRKKIKRLIWNRILTNPYGSERRLVPVSDWPDILLTDQWYFPVNRRRTRSQIWNLEPPSMPTLSACNIIRIYSKVEDYEIKKQNTRRHRIRMRENGGSLDFNFISRLNPAVDENWVCRHRLLQFFLCCVRCSDLFKLFMWTANLLNVTTFLCTDRPFYYFRLLTL